MMLLDLDKIRKEQKRKDSLFWAALAARAKSVPDTPRPTTAELEASVKRANAEYTEAVRRINEEYGS